jgi:hypothetical protein
MIVQAIEAGAAALPPPWEASATSRVAGHGLKAK